MIINSVYTKEFCGHLHDAIYGPVDFGKGVAKQLGKPSETLQSKVNLPARQKAHLRKAYRVWLLYTKYQQFLYDLKARGEEYPLIMDSMDSLHGCHPYGVFFQEPPKGAGFECRRYAVCPWCRFRQAHTLSKKLIPLFREAKQMAYITLSFPAGFLTGEHPLSDLAHENSLEAVKKEHKALINILCKKKDLFFADRVITLPNWRKTSDVNDPVTRYSFNIETTIIGLMDEKKDLPLPENCISPARQKTMPFFGVGRGTWSILKPTQKDLGLVVRETMGFSPALFYPGLDLDEYLIALELKSNFRSVGHGKAR